MIKVFLSHSVQQKDKERFHVCFAKGAEELRSEVLKVFELFTDKCFAVELDVNVLFLCKIAKNAEGHHVERKLLE